MKKQYSLEELLTKIGLSEDESKVYLELLRDRSSHLEISRDTGINRTKVYRIVDDLEELSLVRKVTDDEGSFIEASDPSTLEILLVDQENELKSRRAALGLALPKLHQIEARQGLDPLDFVVRSYDDKEGLKQMLWNELKAEGELLVLGGSLIEDLVSSKRWAEKHRQGTVDSGYKLKELVNPGDPLSDFTDVEGFMDQFEARTIPVEVLPLRNQIIIYNNTVATYHWRDAQKVGVEVINKAYADTYRSIFYKFWAEADPC